MSCKHPIYAVKRFNELTNKNMMYFPYGFNSHLPGDKQSIIDVTDLYNMYGRENVVAIPCGHCLSCKLDYARVWSNRCMLESLDHEKNCFLTLTYDDEHLGDNKLDKKDFQDFMKRLRSNLDVNIRYFACGEYGGKFGRKHMHAIIFGWCPDDVKNIFGHLTSDFVQSTWKKGNVEIGDVTPASCAYVARYCQKKIYTNKSDEFVLMSRRPGIGYNYFKNNFEKIYDYGHVIVNGSKGNIPRFFDKCLEKLNPELLNLSKSARLEKSNLLFTQKINQYCCSPEFVNKADGERNEFEFNMHERRKKDLL